MWKYSKASIMSERRDSHKNIKESDYLLTWVEKQEYIRTCYPNEPNIAVMGPTQPILVSFFDILWNYNVSTKFFKPKTTSIKQNVKM